VGSGHDLTGAAGGSAGKDLDSRIDQSKLGQLQDGAFHMNGSVNGSLHNNNSKNELPEGQEDGRMEDPVHAMAAGVYYLDGNMGDMAMYSFQPQPSAFSQGAGNGAPSNGVYGVYPGGSLPQKGLREMQMEGDIRSIAKLQNYLFIPRRRIVDLASLVFIALVQY
jgi:hypothetical protein